MSFPRYPVYKEPGVEWLGEVPEHWVVSRLGFESWMRARLGWKGLKADEYVEDGFVLLSTPNIKNREIDFENVNFVSRERYDESPEIQLQQGDVLLAKDGSTLGTVNLVRSLPRPATVNSSVAVITPGRRLNGLFLHYLFQSSFLVQTIQRIKGGMGVPHLFQEDLNRFYLPLPPTAEQDSIATFLDRETAKIDALVAEYRTLIELLKEKRQAVISHAVTKGLDPTVPMKDSGVAWLGEVPEHWSVARLKRDLEFLTSGSRGWAEHYADEGALFLRIGNLTRDRITLDLSDIQRVDVPEGSEGERTAVRPGDVLFSITAYLGSVAVVPDSIEEAYVSQHVALARLRGQIFSPEWVAYVTLSIIGQTYLALRGYGGTKIQLSLDDVASLIAPVPSTAEQRAISDFLDRETAKLDSLVTEGEQAISLLQERRTALISAAATGKIDVRGLAAEGDLLEALAQTRADCASIS